ncbi:hypothetical protein Tco_0409837 [Tanacetum coccineum]
MEDAKEIAELQSMMEVIPDEEEVVVDAIPLATKPPSIIDWKIIKEGKIGYYKIIRANGNSKRYSLMIQMLKSFDREDLETLWKLVKAKHGYTRPEEGYERVLWGNLKIMFEHNIEDTLWRNLLGNKVLIWKLFDSCGVYFVSNSRNNEVFGSILLVIMKPLMKKLDDFEDKYQIEGRIVRIKSLLEVTSIKVLVTAAKHKLVLLVILMKTMLSS